MSENGLKAYANLYSPKGHDFFPTADDVVNALNREGISYGINRQNIEDALSRLRKKEVDKVLNILVAEGIPAAEGRPAILCLFFPTEPRSISLLSDEKVDFKELNNLAVAKVGEVVAVLSDEIAPSEGVDVKGNLIKPPHVERNIFRFGRGVVVRENSITARVSGEPIFDGQMLDVIPVLKVSRDVDYHTGNVRFPGSVIVGGSVRDGFTVAAGKDIEIKGNVEAAKVFAGGNVIVKGGIIARGHGKIWAGGNVSARFIENAMVEAGGDVIVERSILHSTVRSRRWVKIISSRPGSIVGGSITALDGVEAYNVGSNFGTFTEILVGVDYVLLDRLLRIEKEMKRIAPIIDEVGEVVERYKERKEALKHLDSSKREKLKKLLLNYKKLSSRLASLKNRRLLIKQKLGTYNGAVVRVRGIVYEKVKIGILQERHITKGKLQFAEFYLNRDRKIDVRPCK